MAEPSGIVEGAVNAASAGGGFAGVLLAGRWLLNWLTGRFDKRQEMLDAQDARVDQEWRAIRESMRAEIDALKAAKAVFERRLTTAEGLIATQTVRLGQQEFVLKLVITELDRVDPGNAVAKQAKILLEQVQPAAFATRSAPTAEEAALIDRIDRTAAG